MGREPTPVTNINIKVRGRDAAMDMSRDGKDIQIYARLLLKHRNARNPKKCIGCLKILEKMVANSLRRLQGRNGEKYFDEVF